MSLRRVLRLLRRRGASGRGPKRRRLLLRLRNYRYQRLAANMGSRRVYGTKPSRGVLAPELVEAMRKPESYRFIIPHWGLGPSLTAKNNGGGMIIGHRGFNRPSINTSAHLDPATGNGIVVFETGHPSLAEDLVEGWIYWQTANGTSS